MEGIYGSFTNMPCVSIPAAVVVFNLAPRSGTSLAFERVYIAAPRGGLFLFQGLVPAADLGTIRTILDSLRLT